MHMYITKPCSGPPNIVVSCITCICNYYGISLFIMVYYIILVTISQTICSKSWMHGKLHQTKVGNVTYTDHTTPPPRSITMQCQQFLSVKNIRLDTSSRVAVCLYRTIDQWPKGCRFVANWMVKKGITITYGMESLAYHENTLHSLKWMDVSIKIPHVFRSVEILPRIKTFLCIIILIW